MLWPEVRHLLSFWSEWLLNADPTRFERSVQPECQGDPRVGQHEGRLQAVPVPQPVDGAEEVGHLSLGRHDPSHSQVFQSWRSCSSSSTSSQCQWLCIFASPWSITMLITCAQVQWTWSGTWVVGSASWTMTLRAASPSGTGGALWCLFLSSLYFPQLYLFYLSPPSFFYNLSFFVFLFFLLPSGTRGGRRRTSSLLTFSSGWYIFVFSFGWWYLLWLWWRISFMIMGGDGSSDCGWRLVFYSWLVMIFSSHDLVDVAREVNRRRAVCRRFVK